MARKRDYYEVLGVDRNVGPDDLKRAYRKLALKFHPDRNKGDAGAAEQFKEAAEAYEVLNDPQKRQIYDQYGHDGLERGGYTRGFSSFEDIISMFNDVFGGGGGSSFFGDIFGFQSAGRGSRTRAERGASLKCELTINLADAFVGVTKTIDLKRNEICETCKGSGAKPGTAASTCSYCQGHGEIQQSQGFFALRTTCPKCRGTGEIIDQPCSKCRGSGRIPKKRSIQVRIPAGVHDGTQMRVSGEGEPGYNGGPRGDLYCIIRVEQHPLFDRDEDDLICQVPISFSQAALGAEIEVPSMKGKAVLKVPSGTQTGRMFRLRSQGMPNVYGHGRGDLLVQVKIETPRKLTPKQTELLKEFAETEEKHVTPERKSFFDKVKTLFESKEKGSEN
jgi:molecular chaperone DnaJ